jgi:hypothetical protein
MYICIVRVALLAMPLFFPVALYHGATPLKIIDIISLLVDNERACQMTCDISPIITLVKRNDEVTHEMTGNNHLLA